MSNEQAVEVFRKTYPSATVLNAFIFKGENVIVANQGKYDGMFWSIVVENDVFPFDAQKAFDDLEGYEKARESGLEF